jgi:hypothetical protein
MGINSIRKKRRLTVANAGHAAAMDNRGGGFVSVIGRHRMGADASLRSIMARSHYSRVFLSLFIQTIERTEKLLNFGGKHDAYQ